MKVSVALCTYNAGARLKLQLDSVLAQERPPCEVVICDDLSTDDTVAIATAFAALAPFPVRIFRNRERLGSTKNFEQAMLACDGEWIALCDQDDIWYPRKLRVLLEYIEDGSAAGVFSDGDLLEGDEQIPGSLWLSFGLDGAELEAFRRGGGDPVQVLLRGNKVTGMTLMLRRDFLSRALPIPAEWTHDAWLAWMLVLYGGLLACPERLVAYRTHQQQQVGIPLRFLPSARQRGLNWVLRELGRRAKQESAHSLLELEQLVGRLQHSIQTPLVAQTLPLLDEALLFLRMRSEIQGRSLLTRAVAVFSNRHAYARFSPRPRKNMLIDLLAAAPDP